jgi:iron complex transport system ATP-binding protein
MRDLTLEHLRIAYGEKTVLGPLDAVFEPHCLHVLAGPNGAGKSTLLRHLSGVLPKQSGTVRLHGKALDQFIRLEKAKEIAYLAQERELVWPLSVREVVMLGRHPHGTSLETATSVDEQAVDEAIEATAISDWADRLVTELSGGERARVLLARALATGATWLLLDEPVAGLDPRQQFLVMAMLQDQVRQGRTVLVVLHDLALAARFADRILLLHQGLAVAHGPVQTVLTQQSLADVFGLAASMSPEANGYNLQIHGVMPCNFR